ncbi:MAG: hypothetical protein J3Q66DRAFT_169852 [Benniella sp.]|nr:MAG: hypothetical protein J3Q66DRAFT_169852 [Benniella sp.]
MSKLLLKVKHGTKRPLPKRPLPLKVDKHRDKHRLGVTTSPRGSNTRMPYHARRQQQYQQETTHPQKIITRPQDDILKQIEFQQRPCLPGPLNGKRDTVSIKRAFRDHGRQGRQEQTTFHPMGQRTRLCVKQSNGQESKDETLSRKGRQRCLVQQGLESHQRWISALFTEEQ